MQANQRSWTPDLEFCKAAFQTTEATDWTRGHIVFRIPNPDSDLLYVKIPGRPTISLQTCKDKDVHIRPSLFQ
jgi:hypothetical protein